MKIVCPRDTLALGLSIVGRAVAARSTLPVLGNILLATDGSRLRIAATNLELGVTCWLDAEIEEQGATTVPARLLSEFVGSLPKAPVEMAYNSRTNTLSLKCSTHQANLKGIDADEFPSAPETNGGVEYRLMPTALQEAIGQVVFAAATDDNRPALSGALLSFRRGALTLVAADGFRLAVRTLDLGEEPAPAADSQPDAGLDIIVPARALSELARIVGDGEDPIQVSITPNRSQIIFRHKDVELYSRLIEANFPNYNAIIPTSHTTRVLVNTREFANAIKIAAFFARDTSNIVQLQISSGEELTPGRLQVNAHASDIGDTNSDIDAIVEGEDTKIAFNSKYLSDVVNVLTTTQISLELSSSSRPGVIRPVGQESYTYVIMPMHLSQTR